MEQPLDIKEFVSRLPVRARAFVDKFPANSLGYSFTPYYSRFRLAPDTIAADGSNNTTYTFSSGHVVTPFQYGQNGIVTGYAASLTAYQQATQADTNLQKGGQTNDGALVVIQGMSIHLSPSSDPFMAQMIWPELSLSSGFGANVGMYRHGLPAFSPGGSGLYGGGTTQGQLPNLGDTNGILPGFPANGFPGEGNIHNSDQLIWFPQSESSSENFYGMQLKFERAVTYVAPGRAAATGVAAIVPPITVGAKGTYVDGWVRLIAISLFPRAQNQ